MNLLSIRMPIRFFTLLLLLIGFIIPDLSFAAPSSIVHEKRRVAGVWAEVITINMNDSDVRLAPAVTGRGIGYSEPFQSFLDRTRPTAAITGTYFDTRSLYPVGDIVIEGNRVHRGVVGTAIGIGWNNEIKLIPTKRGRISDWSGYRHVLAAGPQLLSRGRHAVAPWAEGFSDGGIYRRAPRSAIGITNHNKVLFVVVKEPLHLSELARVMRALGAVDAATLDGGSSTAMYCRGRILRHPQRRLTNILVAYDKAWKYKQALGRLAPGMGEVIAERRREVVAEGQQKPVDTIILTLP